MTDLGLSGPKKGEAGPEPCLYKHYENKFRFYLVEMTRKRVCSQNLAGLRMRR